jgi:hypothetical protein
MRVEAVTDRRAWLSIGRQGFCGWRMGVLETVFGERRKVPPTPKSTRSESSNGLDSVVVLSAPDEPLLPRRALFYVLVLVLAGIAFYAASGQDWQSQA